MTATDTAPDDEEHSAEPQDAPAPGPQDAPVPADAPAAPVAPTRART